MNISHDKPETDFAELVYRGVESDVLDYKSPMNWNTLSGAGKAKIVRHITALANTKGGAVVIGVGEDASGHPSVYTGLSHEESRSFDPSAVGAFVNRHVEPPVDFSIERPEIDGRRYAILTVRPFKTMPHVCAGGVEGELQPGVFYIRTGDATSRAAVRAYELHGLIQRALRNQRELLGRMLRGILYESNVPESPSARFEDEAAATRSYYLHRNPLRRDSHSPVRFEFTLFPPEYDAGRFSIRELRQAAEKAADGLEDTVFLAPAEVREGYSTNTALRIFPDKSSHICQINRSGGVYYSKMLAAPAHRIQAEELHKLIAGAVTFVTMLCRELNTAEPPPEIRLSMSDTLRLELVSRGKDAGAICRISEINFSFTPDLTADPAKTAEDIFRETADRFNFQETDRS